MARPNINRVEELIRCEREEIHDIDIDVNRLREGLLERTPNKFCFRDIARSFFGALVVAFTFVLKGAMVKTAVRLHAGNIIAIMAASIFILIIEIYYFGYRKIKDRERRKPFQFILKRLPTFYLISLTVSTSLVLLYGIYNNPLVNTYRDLLAVIVSISFPASIGAGFSDLMKKY